MSSKKPLTDKQIKFVDEYMKDYNATRAYKAAGYAASTDQIAATHGCRLLMNGKVQEAIQAKREKVAEKDLIDAEYIKQQAHILFRKCAGLDEIDKAQIVDGQVQQVKVKEFNGAAANKALETLGKHVDIQAFKEQLKLEGEVDMISPLVAARKRLESRKKK